MGGTFSSPSVFFISPAHSFLRGEGMNGIFVCMLGAGIVFAALTGRMDQAEQTLLSGGGRALELLVQLCGAYAFFGGLLGILKESGAADRLAGQLEKPMKRLFGFQKGEEAALPDICLNLSANMLGMGGAAAAAGLSAMRTLSAASGHRKTASRAMILFLVINTSSVQLFPASMVALRAQAGAEDPAAVVLPALLATSVSTLVGVGLVKGFLYNRRQSG